MICGVVATRRVYEFIFRLLLVGLVVFPVQLKAQPDSSDAAARMVVTHFHSILLDVMQNGPTLGFTGRFDRLKPVIIEAFNLPRMTILAVGRGWRGLTAAQKRLLIDRFIHYSIASYAFHFNKFDGESFETIGVSPAPSRRMFINTRMILPHEPMPVLLNYLMQRNGDRWQIVDIYLAGMISELASRRSQFSSILRRQGFAALISTLDDKIHELSEERS